MPVFSGSTHSSLPLLLLVIPDSPLVPGADSECVVALDGRTGAESNCLMTSCHCSGDMVAHFWESTCRYLYPLHTLSISTRQGMDSLLSLAFYNFLQSIVELGPFSRLIVHLALDHGIDALTTICSENGRR